MSQLWASMKCQELGEEEGEDEEEHERKTEESRTQVSVVKVM